MSTDKDSSGLAFIKFMESQGARFVDADTREPISLCKSCWCMTHTIDNKCGKCGAEKEDK